MNKKILVLLGSPRKNGNTALMVEAFCKGAKEKGHEVTVLDTTAMHLDGCRHCNSCWKKGRACSCEDDFIQISSKLESSDVLIMAAPMYWGQFPSYLKAAVDKLYAYLMPWREAAPAVKEIGVITCGDMEDESAFDEIVPWYRGVAKFFGWTDIGYVGIPKLVESGDVKKTDGLECAYQMGKIL